MINKQTSSASRETAYINEGDDDVLTDFKCSEVNAPIPFVKHNRFSTDLLNSVDILLLVVTEVEFFSVLRLMTPLPGMESIIRVNPATDSYNIGLFGVYGAALVQCDMGSGGSGGSPNHSEEFVVGKSILELGAGSTAIPSISKGASIGFRACS